MLKNCESEIEVLQYLNLGIVLRFKDVPKSAVAHRPGYTAIHNDTDILNTS